MDELRRINLNALRIAESAARNGSFVRAAEEQCVSTSAVSQRIKKLESELQFDLFHRGNNSVRMTPQGEQFILEVREALDQIHRASTARQRRDRKRTLNLCALPTFIVRWLMRRLPGFQTAWPQVQLGLSHSYDIADFARQDFDLAIWYGNGNFSGLESQLLFREDLTPVCAPAYFTSILAQHADRVLDPTLLAHCTLINSATCMLNWRSWLEFAGVGDIYDKVGKIEFDSCLMTYDAAAAGLGVAVSNRAYVLEDLKSGRLIAPFPIRQQNKNGWYLIWPRQQQLSKPAEAFSKWIREEAALSVQAVQDLQGATSASAAQYVLTDHVARHHSEEQPGYHQPH